MRARTPGATIPPMLRHLALAAVALAATAGAVTTAHAGASWTTGTYQGTAASDNAMPKDRGKVVFTVTRTHARADRLTLVMRCDSGATRRFTVRAAGRAALRPGPAGAGFHLRGQRHLDGYHVGWDLSGGIHGSRLRSTIDATARDGADDCLLFGLITARPTR